MKKTQILENNLGIKFRVPVILEEALTHRSFLNETEVKRHSNERLEFLGDAILAFLVSEHLFNHNPNSPEGELTNLRSLTVRTSTLAMVARKLKLGEYLLLSKGEEESGGRNNSSLLADCFEAVVGAIYLDQGLNVTQKFVRQNLIDLLPKIIANGSVRDHKSRLQEKVQEEHRISPTYQVIKETGPDHAKTFRVAVYLAQKNLGTGQGKSKQEAEQQAAKVALEKLPKKANI